MTIYPKLITEAPRNGDAIIAWIPKLHQWLIVKYSVLNEKWMITDSWSSYYGRFCHPTHYVGIGQQHLFEDGSFNHIPITGV